MGGKEAVMSKDEVGLEVSWESGPASLDCLPRVGGYNSEIKRMGSIWKSQMDREKGRRA